MIDTELYQLYLLNLVRLHAFDHVMQDGAFDANSFETQFSDWQQARLRTKTPSSYAFDSVCNFILDTLIASGGWAVPSFREIKERKLPSGSEFQVVATGAQLDQTRLEQIITALRSEIDSPGIRADDQLIHSSALAINFRSNVVILGETGTGKRRLARLIHRLGADSEQPLIFIGATDLTPSTVQKRVRSGGTIVIIEAGELEPEVQNALCQALVDTSLDKHVQIVATASSDLGDLVEGGKFRRDLFYRLAPVSVCLHPLRERLIDMRILAEFFIKRHCEANRNFTGEILSTAALQKLSGYDWPGNLHELQAVLRHALRVCPDDAIGAEHIDFSAQPF